MDKEKSLEIQLINKAVIENNTINSLVELKQEFITEKALNSSIKCQELLTNAEILKKEKNYEEAERYCRDALEIAPNNYKAYISLGNILILLKKCEEIEKCFLKAIEINPSDDLPYKYLANFYNTQKNYNEADHYYRMTIQLNPTSSNYNIFGIFLVKRGKQEKAEKYLRKSIELDPKACDLYNNLGLLLKQLKRYKEAEEYFRKSYEINPTDSNEAKIFLGNMFSELERITEAVECYKQGLIQKIIKVIYLFLSI